VARIVISDVIVILIVFFFILIVILASITVVNPALDLGLVETAGIFLNVQRVYFCRFLKNICSNFLYISACGPGACN